MYSLTIEDNNGQIAEQFSFDHGSYLIGRHEECDIVLPSSSVSRRHANLFVEDGRCYIEDLNSANGVTVDGQRVINQRHLGTASQVRIGDYYLYLEYQEDETLDDQDVRKTLFISEDEEHNKLVRIGDEFAGEEFMLSEVDNTIGRTDDNFILLSDPSISRQHARIVQDGDAYTLYDLGSSNGTRLNDEEILEPTQLTPGDVVEFGNLEFAFVPGGEEIDPSQYESSQSSDVPILFASAVTVVALACVGLGGALVYWAMDAKNSSPPSQSAPTLDSKAKAALDRGKTRMDDKEWEDAIQAFKKVLASVPDHEEAKTLLEQARREKRGQSLYEEGLELSQAGKHREALEVLRSIPEETVAAENAKPTLKHVKKSVAYKLRQKAEDLMESDEPEKLKTAHDKLVEAISLAPDEEKALETIRKLEEKMEDLGVDFDAYESK